MYTAFSYAYTHSHTAIQGTGNAAYSDSSHASTSHIIRVSQGTDSLKISSTDQVLKLRGCTYVLGYSSWTYSEYIYCTTGYSCITSDGY